MTTSHAGSYTEQEINRKTADDPGNYFHYGLPAALQDFGQELLTTTCGYSHELRLSSSEPLFNQRMDYVVGAMYQYNNSPSELANFTRVFMGSNFLTVAETPILRGGDSTEKSVFGNLTFYLTDDTELSVGGQTHQVRVLLGADSVGQRAFGNRQQVEREYLLGVAKGRWTAVLSRADLTPKRFWF